MQPRMLHVSFVSLALVCSAALLAPGLHAQEAPKQEIKQEDSVPPGGSAGGQSHPDQNAKQEPSAKVEGSNSSPEVFVNGALNVPGARTDVDTIPSKFSERAAADDKLPIAAHTFKHLTAEQQRAIRSAIGGSAARGSGSRAIGGYAKIGAEIPTDVALEGLKPLPATVITQLPEMKEITFTTSENKVLLVNAKSRMVVAVIE